MRQIRDDLWETAPDSPFPGLTTHAYLWTPPGRPNVLFYATSDTAGFAAMQQLGGVGHQYLSHRDEAGPSLAKVAGQFGAMLHAPSAERREIAEFAEPDVLLDRRHVDELGIEVVPAPGHSPGSTCYLVRGAHGTTYLFTGDTIYLGGDDRWTAGYLPGISDREQLAASLELLATLEPDVVVSSAFTGDDGAHALGDRPWADCVAEALATLRA